MSEENKAVVRRFLEAFAADDRTTLEEVLAPNFVYRGTGAPDGGGDKARHIQGIGAFEVAFADFGWTIEDQIAEADRVATRLTWSAVHSGDFNGIPATGRHVSVPGIDMARVADGRIVERWYTMELLGLMQQLGAIPAAGGS